jgi:hypothetical protein
VVAVVFPFREAPIWNPWKSSGVEDQISFQVDQLFALAWLFKMMPFEAEVSTVQVTGEPTTGESHKPKLTVKATDCPVLADLVVQETLVPEGIRNGQETTVAKTEAEAFLWPIWNVACFTSLPAAPNQISNKARPSRPAPPVAVARLTQSHL